jgi:hypothetical protein
VPRPLNKIAAEIKTLWGTPAKQRPSFMVFAMPYVEAMLDLSDLTQCYGVDPAEDIVLYFLSNAAPWRGEDAKRIKAELNLMLKEHKCKS